MINVQLEPSQVVMDQVLRFSAKMPRMGEVAVMKTGDMPTLIMTTRNHRGDPLTLHMQVHFDGEPVDGPEPRFVLYKLGATVWKLSPSILHPMLHCYLTIVDVPELAPWNMVYDKV